MFIELDDEFFKNTKALAEKQNPKKLKIGQSILRIIAK